MTVLHLKTRPQTLAVGALGIGWHRLHKHPPRHQGFQWAGHHRRSAPPLRHCADQQLHHVTRRGAIALTNTPIPRLAPAAVTLWPHNHPVLDFTASQDPSPRLDRPTVLLMSSTANDSPPPQELAGPAASPPSTASVVTNVVTIVMAGSAAVMLVSRATPRPAPAVVMSGAAERLVASPA
eukprot:CAMPEP_0204357608 /NCGR_PEP_ID=MMETSP0469-20131031/35870_1 /ASSEMBLY_ACC=CAM_ASM_000384 /TAXON_ID=2969 /ORGANISM="Oxyrrhis marina" /LENGTH=179 /DNA_ID=CAMNT_0051345287 /DNA_START=66 /DNA_END=602 /DNA_ORIENTATION=-